MHVNFPTWHDAYALNLPASVHCQVQFPTSQYNYLIFCAISFSVATQNPLFNKGSPIVIGVLPYSIIVFYSLPFQESKQGATNLLIHLIHSVEQVPH